MITIKDGVAIINGEPVSEDVDYNDHDLPSNRPYRERRFRIDVGNGYKLSVVFGSGTYSDNHGSLFDGEPWHEEVKTAELGVLVAESDGTNGGLCDVFEAEWGDCVKGWATPEEILSVLTRLRALPPRESVDA